MFFSGRPDAEQCNALQMWHTADRPENMRSDLSGVTFVLFCSPLCFLSRLWPFCISLLIQKKQLWCSSVSARLLIPSSIRILCRYLTRLPKHPQICANLVFIHSKLLSPGMSLPSSPSTWKKQYKKICYLCCLFYFPAACILFRLQFHYFIKIIAATTNSEVKKEDTLTDRLVKI